MTAGSFAHIGLMARAAGGAQKKESGLTNTCVKTFWVIALASCVLFTPRVCAGGTHDREIRDSAFEISGNVAVAATRPRSREVLEWLDRDDYTADELLLFEKMPVIISGGWRRPTWWPGSQGGTQGWGKGLALSGPLFRYNNSDRVFGERVVKYSADCGLRASRHGVDRGRRAREWSSPNDFA